MEEGADTSGNSRHQLTVTLGNILHQVMDRLAPCWAYNKLIFSHCLPETVSIFTGTVICPIYGNKIKLCLQEKTKSVPLVIVELPLSTRGFTSSIQAGVLRIVLEPVDDPGSSGRWVTYCNGQKKGFSRRLGVGEEKWVLEKMQMVSAGAGIVLHRGTETGGYKYLRGQFERVVGSDDSEAYHLIDPSHCFGQEFSIFFVGN